MSMSFSENSCYHVYNQGNNRKPVFFERKHYLLFLTKFRTFCLPYCHVLAYCLMPNHFHFMIYTKRKVRENPGKLNIKIGTLLSSYSQAVNKQNDWSGSIFRATTKAKELMTSDNVYPRVCFHYIHQNPVKATLANKLEDWEFSSYRDYAGLRNGTLPDKKFIYRWFNINKPSEFIAKSNMALDSKFIEKLY